MTCGYCSALAKVGTEARKGGMSQLIPHSQRTRSLAPATLIYTHIHGLIRARGSNGSMLRGKDDQENGQQQEHNCKHRYHLLSRSMMS